MGIHGDAARLSFVHRVVCSLAAKARIYDPRHLHDWPTKQTTPVWSESVAQVEPVFRQFDVLELDAATNQELGLEPTEAPDLVTIVSVLEQLDDVQADAFLLGLRRKLQRWSAVLGRPIPCLVVTLEPRFFLGDLFEELHLGSETDPTALRTEIHEGSVKHEVVFDHAVPRGEVARSVLSLQEGVAPYVHADRYCGLLEGLLWGQAKGLTQHRSVIGDRAPLVLDLGCGEGNLGRLLATQGIRFVGVDKSHSMIAAAAKGFKPKRAHKLDAYRQSSEVWLRTERWYERRLTDAALTVVDQLPMLRQFLPESAWPALTKLAGYSRHCLRRGPFYCWLVHATPSAPSRVESAHAKSKKSSGSDAQAVEREREVLIEELQSLTKEHAWPASTTQLLVELLADASTECQVLNLPNRHRLVHAGGQGGMLYVVLEGRLSLMNDSGIPFMPFFEGEILGELELGATLSPPSPGAHFVDRFLYNVDVTSDSARVLYIPPRAVKALLSPPSTADGSVNEASSHFLNQIYRVLRGRFAARNPILQHDVGNRSGLVAEDILPILKELAGNNELVTDLVRDIPDSRQRALNGILAKEIRKENRERRESGKPPERTTEGLSVELTGDRFFQLVARALIVACGDEASSDSPGYGDLVVATPGLIGETAAVHRSEREKGDDTPRIQRALTALSLLSVVEVFGEPLRRSWKLAPTNSERRPSDVEAEMLARIGDAVRSEGGSTREDLLVPLLRRARVEADRKGFDWKVIGKPVKQFLNFLQNERPHLIPVLARSSLNSVQPSPGRVWLANHDFVAKNLDDWLSTQTTFVEDYDLGKTDRKDNSTHSYCIFRKSITDAAQLVLADEETEKVDKWSCRPAGLWNTELLRKLLARRALIAVPNVQHLWLLATNTRMLMGYALVFSDRYGFADAGSASDFLWESELAIERAFRVQKRGPIVPSLPARFSDELDVRMYLNRLQEIGFHRFSKTTDKDMPIASHDLYLRNRAVDLYSKLKV